MNKDWYRTLNNANGMEGATETTTQNAVDFQWNVSPKVGAESADSCAIRQTRGERPCCLETCATHTNGSHTERSGSPKWPRGCTRNQQCAFRIHEGAVMCRICHGVDESCAGKCATSSTRRFRVPFLDDAMSYHAHHSAFVYTKSKKWIASATCGPLWASHVLRM